MSLVHSLAKHPHLIEATEGVMVVEPIFAVPIADRIDGMPVRFCRVTARERARIKMEAA